MSTQHRRVRSITSLIQAQHVAAQNGFLGGMTVLSIMVTAHTVRWGNVRQRLSSHPDEAKQLDEHGKTVLYKALSRRRDDYPSVEEARQLVQANRAAAWEGVVDLYEGEAAPTDQRIGALLNPRGDALSVTNSPLIVAAWRRAPLEILQCLAAARPSVPSQDVAALVSCWNSYREFYGGEEELVNLLCGGGREARSVFAKLHCLLRYCTVPGKSLISLGGSSSLHRAASAQACSLELFRVILQRFPECIRQQDHRGRLPLHCLMVLCADNKMDAWEEQNSRVKRMKILLEQYPGALEVADSNGRLPLHLAIRAGWHHLHLMEMVETCPESLSVRDGLCNLYPFQMAAQQDLSLTIVFKLLRTAPDLVANNIPSLQSNDAIDTANMVTSEISTSSRDKIESSANIIACLGKGKKESVVSDEIKSLLQHVRIEHDELWVELQSLLSSSFANHGGEWKALHAAVSLPECPIGLIRVLMHMHPEQLDQRAGPHSRTPLHCAAANAAKSLLATTPTVTTADTDDLRTIRLQALLQAQPLAAQVRDAQGQLPLHLAVVRGMPAPCVEALIRAWPEALCQRDGQQSLYPFLLAACSSAASLSDVFSLLVRAPHVLSVSGVVD